MAKSRQTRAPTATKAAGDSPVVTAGAGSDRSSGIQRSQKPTAIWLAAFLIVAAGSIAYSNSLQGPFIFDDVHNIVNNTSIRNLGNLSDVLLVHSKFPIGLDGRPVVNFSFAVDYAFGKLDPVTFHATNLAIHLLAGLTLFGIVRRTLLLPAYAARFGCAATQLAFVTALLWVVHPLQTGAVTYVVQRCESLMGLFYLLSIYGLARCAASPHPRRWMAFTVLTGLLALGSKEVAVSLPLCLLLYDRIFLAGSFRELWQRRRGMYLWLLLTWTPLVIYVCLRSDRAGSAGFGTGISSLEYARSQPGVILHYLWLSIWPDRLVFDYAWPVATRLVDILPGAVVVGGLLLATLVALYHGSAWGFLGAWFFLILAPTSSIMPIADLAFEHRMYLPLAALIVTATVGGFMAIEKVAELAHLSRERLLAIGGTLASLAAIVLAILTWQRNSDYRSGISIWQDTANKAPHNARAHSGLGNFLDLDGQPGQAIVEFRKMVELQPHDAEAHNKLGAFLAVSGDRTGAIAEYEKALELQPEFAEPHNNLGILASKENDLPAAISHFEMAIKFQPTYADAHCNLGNAFVARGDLPASIAEFEKALELNPELAEAHNNLGTVLFTRGNISAAVEHFRRALALKPEYFEARRNLNAALIRQGQITLPSPSAGRP